ncbi:MAG: hypothetical protein AMXMBFR13_31230 [Phycisphaerae bacterium]
MTGASLNGRFIVADLKRGSYAPIGRPAHDDYLTFYQAVPDGMEVIRILHGARRLRRHFKRRSG